jgi:hypothetical protein
MMMFFDFGQGDGTRLGEQASNKAGKHSDSDGGSRAVKVSTVVIVASRGQGVATGRVTAREDEGQRQASPAGE